MSEATSNENTPAPAPSGPGSAPGVTFADLGLRPEILRALSDMGFTAPMDVQAKTFPVVQSGRDLMVQSRTGSGKTAAFGIPIADRLVNPADKFVQAIILLPTRELALQVAAELARIVAHLDITVVPVYGGAPMGRQIEQLRAGGQIVCGTPGRVLDHLRRGTLQLDRVRVAVLDECDEMLSMGFQEDIEAILERTPQNNRQTLLFSATVPDGIQRLSKRFMRNPEHLKLSADFVGVHEIAHNYYSISGTSQREQDLLRILEFENPGRAIIFCNTREETGRVAEFLRTKGQDAEAISSDLSQSDRERVMGLMRAGKIRFLVATDVAARGIDLEGLSHVFNYTFPESPEVYIHRTGRTGRAGKHGVAVSLIGPTEVGAFYYLKLLYKIKPEERSLPSEIEIRTRREGEKVVALRAAFASDPGVGWRSLAKRVMSAADGERLLGSLLREHFESAAGSQLNESPVVAAVPQVVAPRAMTDGQPPPARRDERPGHDRGPRRDRPGRDDRRDGRGEPRRESRWGARRDERAGEAVAAPVASAARGPIASPVPVARPVDVPTTPVTALPEVEFSDVWSDAPAPAPVAAAAPAAAAVAPPARATAREAGPGETRLYLNLGRKDGATVEDVEALVREVAGVAPSSLDVMNTHTYLNVPSAVAEAIVGKLNGRDHAGRVLQCEAARPRRR